MGRVLNDKEKKEKENEGTIEKYVHHRKQKQKQNFQKKNVYQRKNIRKVFIIVTKEYKLLGKKKDIKDG